jgi:hypothetical protein
MDGQRPYGREDLIKRIDEYLKEIDKRPKYNNIDNQQSDENSKKMSGTLEKSGIVENLNIYELKYLLKDRVKDLKELLNEIHQYVKEKTSIFKINEYNAVIDSDCKKINNDLISCESHIKMYFYNEAEKFICILDSQQPPYYIECTHCDYKRDDYSHKFDSFKMDSFIRSIREKIPDIYKILYPELHKYRTSTDISMNPNKPKKVVPELRISGNLTVYDEGIFFMKVLLIDI